jgi:hypothetical protein
VLDFVSPNSILKIGNFVSLVIRVKSHIDIFSADVSKGKDKKGSPASSNIAQS